MHMYVNIHKYKCKKNEDKINKSRHLVWVTSGVQKTICIQRVVSGFGGCVARRLDSCEMLLKGAQMHGDLT